MVTLDFGNFKVDMRDMASVWAKVFPSPDFQPGLDTLGNGGAGTRAVTYCQVPTSDGVNGTGAGSGAAVWFTGYGFGYDGLGRPLAGTCTKIEVDSAADVNNGTYRLVLSGFTLLLNTVPVVNPEHLNSAVGLASAHNFDQILQGQALKVLGFNYADYLLGGELGDQLGGYNGGDTLVGAAGNDLLWGGNGHDHLKGGAGNDKFLFGTEALSASNSDTVSDFKHGTDKLEFDASEVAGVGPKGALAGAKFYKSANVDVAGAHDADDRVLYDTTSGNLYYDADGNGAAAKILVAVLTGHPTISAADFQIIS